MGGGRKSSNDPPKGAPRDPLLLLASRPATGEGPAAARAYSFCEEPRRLAFQASPGTRVLAGRVRLRAASPPEVVSGTRVVGALTGAIADAIRDCLEMGYRIEGDVEQFDAISGVGTLDVRSERAGAA